MEASFIPVKSPVNHRTKLQDLWQRAPCHHASTWWVEALSHGHLPRFWNLDRSPKSPIFPETTKAKSTASSLGYWISRILFHSLSQSQHHQQKDRPPEPTGRPWTRQDDNNQVIVLKSEHFLAMIMPTINEAHEHIKSATHDVHLWDVNIVSSINHNRGMELQGGLVWYDNRIYILRNHMLQGEIIAWLHDHITAGHPGEKRPRSLSYRNTGGPRWRKILKPISVPAKHASKPNQACKLKQCPFIQMSYLHNHGPIFP